jgi:hypothetical protein
MDPMNTITITLTQDDLNTLSALLDAGVKALGLNAVKPAAMLLVKLETAVAEANKPPSMEKD